MDSIFSRKPLSSKLTDTPNPPRLATKGDLLDFAQFEAMLGGFSRTCRRCGWLSPSEIEFVVSAKLCNMFHHEGYR